MVLAKVQKVTQQWTTPSTCSDAKQGVSILSPLFRMPSSRNLLNSSRSSSGLDVRSASQKPRLISVQSNLRGAGRRLGRLPAVASQSAGSTSEQAEAAAIANRNPYLEGDFDIEDDGEWEEVPLHRVKIQDTQSGSTFEVDVPEDRYILHSAEEQGHKLPFACRMGCCTSCAVRVKSGRLYQPLALGISSELKAQGYALMCVAYPLSDVEIETQDEDEVYYLQFGRYFARGPIERDDIALEIALQDE